MTNPVKPRITPSRWKSGRVVEYAVYVDGLEGRVVRAQGGPFTPTWRGSRVDGIETPYPHASPERAAQELVQAGLRAEEGARRENARKAVIMQLRADAGMVGNRRLVAICSLALGGDPEALAECEYIISQNEGK